jgi:hypothetical protein
LFGSEKGESQMWGQRSLCYAATVRSHLLAKIHQVQSSIVEMDCKQNHPLDCLDECVDFMGEASDKLGRFINVVIGLQMIGGYLPQVERDF